MDSHGVITTELSEDALCAFQVGSPNCFDILLFKGLSAVLLFFAPRCVVRAVCRALSQRATGLTSCSALAPALTSGRAPAGGLLLRRLAPAARASLAACRFAVHASLA